ncbi:hypothetical protein NUBL10701_24640 [Klebsiella pneumoniae]|nr:hypothetical protein NUBL10699_33400 [Klebsiella pneumoniae]GKK58914.1 hypothetical protein NUBL10701_24640 [Klebsiella pneumoniae]
MKRAGLNPVAPASVAPPDEKIRDGTLDVAGWRLAPDPAYNPYHSNQSRFFFSPDKTRQAPHPGMQRR